MTRICKRCQQTIREDTLTALYDAITVHVQSGECDRRHAAQQQGRGKLCESQKNLLS